METNQHTLGRRRPTTVRTQDRTTRPHNVRWRWTSSSLSLSSLTIRLLRHDGIIEPWKQQLTSDIDFTFDRSERRVFAQRPLVSQTFLGLFLLACFCLDSVVIAAVAVVAQEGTTTLQCPRGWGNDQKPQSIPTTWINDGYCDCPTTGADEWETAACSGSTRQTWPGTSSSSSKDAPIDSPVFVCPQQPKLRLPFSRVQDGICDCCDGADEMDTETSCPDECDTLLAAERAEAAKLRDTYISGSAERVEQLELYQKWKLEMSKKMEKLQADLFFLNQEWNRTVTLIHKWKVTALDDRLDLAIARSLTVATKMPTSQVVDENLKGLLEGMTDTELQWFIVHACQMAGEILQDNDEIEGSTGTATTTCVPLRLAGLDTSLIWEPGTYALKQVKDSNEEQKLALAEILDYNWQQPRNTKVWNDKAIHDIQAKDKRSKGRGGRRRLEEMYNDDEMYYDDDYRGRHHNSKEDENDEDEEDDHYEDPPYHHYEHRAAAATGSVAKADAPTERREELLAMIRLRSFSKSRITYLEMSEDLLNYFEFLQESEEKKARSEENEDDTSEASTVPDITFDPMALPMMTNQLERRQRWIRRGFNYAVSARVLLDAVQDAYARQSNLHQMRYVLFSLAMGTMNHGNLSSIHFWQLIRYVIPELSVSSFTDGAEDGSNSSSNSRNNEQSCPSPWADICPVIQIDRAVDDMRMVKIPPLSIVKAVETYCEQQQSAAAALDSAAVSAVCASTARDNGTTPTVPTEVPDGYFGYFALQPRTTEDIFHGIFHDWTLQPNPDARAELTELEQEREKVATDRQQIQEELSELEALLGISKGSGDGGSEAGSSKYGSDGELYALRDECFNVPAGKYVYELCMFGSASQKEHDQHGRGTDLGRWKGFTIDDETGQRVWMWQDGAKCWNGPKRSATVYVTCGVGSEIISADEPDTCRYVFEMQSYVACDETFRLHHGL